MIELRYSSKFKTTDNIEIYYETNFLPNDFKEDDVLLIFNYGLVCNRAHWDYQIPYFNRLGYKVILHDYRAHHKSSGQEQIETCTFNNIVKDIHELISSIGAKNVFMFGHSMGVNVTLEYSKQFPDDLLGMALLSGTVFAPDDMIEPTGLGEVAFMLIKELTERFPNEHEFVIRHAYRNPIIQAVVHRGGYHKDNVTNEYVKDYLQKIGELHPKLFFQLFKEMKEHQILFHLGNINTPSIVIGGDRDLMVPLNIQKFLHDHLDNSEIFIVRNGSHVPQADFPKFINQRCDLFMTEILASRK